MIKVKRIFIITFLFILMTLLCGCFYDGITSDNKTATKDKNVSPTIPTTTDASSSILSDRKFKRGFVVRGLGIPIYKNHADEETFGSDAYDPGYKFQYGKDDLDPPLWQICQWSTRYAFHDESITTFTANGTEYTYANPSKLLKVNTQTGEFTLGLDADKCYVYGDREPLMEWPHLLIARDINRSFLTKISDKNELRIVLDAKLDRYEDKMTIEPHPYIHAAQCMFYLYIANYNEVSGSFDDMLWLGMSIFDNRVEYTDEFAKQDSNSKESETNKYIYNVASNEYLSEGNNFYENGSIKVGSSAHIDFDILPYVNVALTKAKEAGCMVNTDYNNLYVNGMYIGFELPGTYNIQMTFNNMDIRVK